MNTAQKIIKYCAISFAVFLIVTIFSGIVYGILGIATVGTLISDNSSVESKCENVEERCLQVNLGVSELIIKKGDKLTVETKSEAADINEDGNSLIITDKSRNLFNNFKERGITVYIPEDMEFEKVAISGGAGSIYIESLRTKSLEMALGVGETKIDALETDDAKISTGIGEVVINLMSSSSQYEIRVDKGLGDITFNGSSVSKNSTIGNGDKKLSVSGGIGDIKITTFDR